MTEDTDMTQTKPALRTVVPPKRETRVQENTNAEAETAPGFKLLARLRELEKLILPDCPSCGKVLSPLSRRSVPMSGGASQITLFECAPCERFYEMRAGLHVTYDPNEQPDKIMGTSEIIRGQLERKRAASEAITAFESP